MDFKHCSLDSMAIIGNFLIVLSRSWISL